MPTRPRRSCSVTGCTNFVPCPDHSWRKVYEFKRGTRQQRGYDEIWRRARAFILSREPLCRICKRAEATEVDHIVPLSQGGARLDSANLQPLCKPCHLKKTRAEEQLLSQAL